MINLEILRKSNNISLNSIGNLINKTKGRISNLEKGHRSVNSVEIEKLKILDRAAANFNTQRQTKGLPIIVKDQKLQFKLDRDKVTLRKLVHDLKKLNEKIEPLEIYLHYLSYLQDEPIIADTLEYEYAYRSTKENLEKLVLKRQYMLIEKASLSAAIAVNKKFNKNPK